jgi:hypothetical protein
VVWSVGAGISWRAGAKALPGKKRFSEAQNKTVGGLQIKSNVATLKVCNLDEPRVTTSKSGAQPPAVKADK